MIVPFSWMTKLIFYSKFIKLHGVTFHILSRPELCPKYLYLSTCYLQVLFVYLYLSILFETIKYLCLYLSKYEKWISWNSHNNSTTHPHVSELKQYHKVYNVPCQTRSCLKNLKCADTYDCHLLIKYLPSYSTEVL